MRRRVLVDHLRDLPPPACCRELALCIGLLLRRASLRLPSPRCSFSSCFSSRCFFPRALSAADLELLGLLLARLVFFALLLLLELLLLFLELALFLELLLRARCRA